MLYLIGLGLYDEEDLSLKAINAMKLCSSIYAELYTSCWQGSLGNVEKLVGKSVKLLKREEAESDFLIDEAKEKIIALLVPGDPLVATTHFQFLIDAKRRGVDVDIIHAPSVTSAIAITGLHSYKFGRTTTLPFPVGDYFPESPYEAIEANRKIGLHTLVLLDTGCKNTCMKITDGLKLLLELEKRIGRKALSAETEIVACVALGSRNQMLKLGKIEELISSDLSHDSNNVPCCIVIPGEMSWKEKEAVGVWK